MKIIAKIHCENMETTQIHFFPLVTFVTLFTLNFTLRHFYQIINLTFLNKLKLHQIYLLRKSCKTSCKVKLLLKALFHTTSRILKNY